MTFLTSIDGHLLKEMIIDGAAMLEKNKAAIDALNVFPVPDGDTGTNMSLTIMSAVKELAGVDSQDASVVAAAIARGALKGARGNSGVILSQLFRGFAEGVKDCAAVDAKAFAQGMKLGVDKAYKAVMKPKEGTILTVARAIANHCEACAEKNGSIYTLMDEIIAVGNDTLKKTPDMLPVLKQAGVVDSGGAGLMAIYLGFKMAVNGEEIESVTDLANKITALAGQEAAQLPAGTGAAMDEGEIEFGYCTETFITHLKEGVTMEDVDQLRSKLMEFGDCVLVVGDLELVKVHCHSNDPGRILRYCIKLGELDNIKVENMRTQHRTIIEEAKAVQEKHTIEKEVGFVAVCAGDGIAALFKDLTVDETVMGGQTMNPSTDDIAQAIYRCKAQTTYVLPNNKNIIMAAQQAAELMEDRTVVVIPTKTIPQGVAAMIAYVPDVTLDENRERMTEAAGSVRTGSVTYAIRDSVFDGKEIKENDILGLNEGTVACVGQDVADTTIELMRAMVTEDDELITLFYGADVSEEDAEALRGRIGEAFPDCDLEMLSGGQPLYYYLFSIE